LLESGQQQPVLQIVDAASSFWTTAELSKLLVTAGQHDNIAAAIWLRAQGAQWPLSFASFNYSITTNDPSSRPWWSVRAMQWALANGCTWGTSWVSCYAENKGAAAVWAHASGISCYCHGSKLPAGIRVYCTSLQLYAQQQLQQHDGSAVTFDFHSYSMPALQPLQQHKQRATTAAAAAAAAAMAVAQRRPQQQGAVVKRSKAHAVLYRVVLAIAVLLAAVAVVGLLWKLCDVSARVQSTLNEQSCCEPDNVQLDLEMIMLYFQDRNFAIGLAMLRGLILRGV
jgi:hypothetical protein